MHGTISYEDLDQKVTELRKRALNTTKVQQKTVWEQLFGEPQIDELHAGFALFTEDFVLTKCNRTYREFIARRTPYTAQSALGMCHFDYKPGCEKFTGKWFRHVRDSGRGESCYDFELGVLEDGQYTMSRWDVHMSPVTDSLGRVAGTVMYCLDVTEPKVPEVFYVDGDGRNEINGNQIRQGVRVSVGEPSVDEMKAALKVLLALREEDKLRIGKELLLNLEQKLLPWIEKLKRTQVNVEQRTYIELIESNLSDIALSLPGGITSAFPVLTAREMEVAQLLKLGRTSKEIASVLGISKDCVDFHRNNLRKKLGLNKRKGSLRNRLCSLS